MTLKPLVLVAAAMLAACGDSTTAPTLYGVYRLMLVNGGPLPAVLTASAPDTIRAVGGTLTLRGDGSWVAEMLLARTRGDLTVPTVTNASGTYTRAGGTLDLRQATDGSVVSATVRGLRLTTAIDGVLLEFERK